MQLISLELSDATLRERAGRFTTAELGLGRDPEEHENVVIHDTWTGDYFTGMIATAFTSDGDAVHELRLGMRLPEAMAMARVTGFPATGAPQQARPLADLYAELRRTV
jgi:hypothetical protein